MKSGDESIEAYRRKRAGDPRSSEELIALALGKWWPESDDEDDDGTTEMFIVAARGTRHELDLLNALSRSKSIKERGIAAFTLGRMGYGVEVFPEEILERLLALTEDPDLDVVTAAAYSLGQAQRPPAISRLIELASSPSEHVRLGVAYALDIQSSPDVVGTLIRLTRDTDARVRDWATFAFNNGHQERDSEEIRTALLDRTDDEDAEARGEALIALARRHDARVADLIRRELEREPEGDWAIEAADLLADSSLLPDLEVARGRFPSTESIESVIVRLRATR